MDAPRSRRWRFFLKAVIYVIAGAVVGALALPGTFEALTRDHAADLEEAVPTHARDQFAHIEAHLDGPYDGYGAHQVLHDNFDIVALSHMAAGVMNLHAAGGVDEARLRRAIGHIARRAVSPKTSPFGRAPADVEDLGDHGLYLSHLNLVLGAYRHITGQETYDELHTRISEHVRARSLADGDYHMRSYPAGGAPGAGGAKWPADQSVTLASLHLYDRVRGTKLSRKPIRGWLRAMDKKFAVDDSSLHRSAIFDIWYAEYPRGCATSWTLLYMTQFAPDRAGELYADYRERFGDWFAGWGGFREWPERRPEDADWDWTPYGPVVGGLGMAATGLGLGATRIYRDRELYVGIMRGATSVGKPALVGPRNYLVAPLLGDAILLHGTTARRWFDEPPEERGYDGTVPVPLGLYILFALESALTIFLLVRGVQTLRWMYRGNRFS
jgi:hypothetical protein